MTTITRALWKRRLAYRELRLAYWRHRNHRAEIAKWERLVSEARAKLAAPPSKPVPAKGIDVSNLQGTIDFNAVKRAGYRFAFVKAGEGNWDDPDFRLNVQHAKAAGLKVGAYQFLRPRPGRTGAQEAAFFIENLHRAGLGHGDLRPVLDVEATQLDRAGTHAYVKSFVNAMHAHGFRPMIYTGTWFWGPKVGDDDFDLPLWIAAYQAHEPTLPKPWTTYAVWQHSDKGVVPGVRGHVDVNKTPDLRKVTA